MGIIRLGQFIKKTFPQVIKEKPAISYKGGTYAIDASSTIYSFLVKTISFSKSKGTVNVLTDSMGNQTGHLLGLLYRALLCRQLGIKPVWVFDGKPPREKFSQLSRRKRLKQEAADSMEEALEEGNLEEAAKLSQRSIYVSETEREDAKKLIQLMGMPVIQAKSEAESQCAILAKKCLVDGVIGEDMDTLVFGATKLIRKFSRENASNEIELSFLLQELNITNEQFIDFCILCGCDYTTKIPNIGPVKALKMIKQKGTIEQVLNLISNDSKMRARHPIPDDFNFLKARTLFKKPEILDLTAEHLQPTQFREDQLRLFLTERQFSDDRIKKWISVYKKFS